MKILVNATNCKKGGAIQVASTIVSELLSRECDVIALVTPSIKNNLIINHKSSKLGLNIVCIDRTFWNHKSVNDKVLSIERKMQPDIVFTVFGPSYFNFKSPHAIGFANGWFTHIDAKTIFSIFRFNVFKYLKFFVKKFLFYVYLIANKNAYYIFESNMALMGFKMRYSFISKANLHLVPNSYSSNFTTSFNTSNLRKDLNTLRVFYPAAYYPHKNHKFFIALAERVLARQIELKFEFYFTIEDIFFKNFLEKVPSNCRQYFKNVGPSNESSLIFFYQYSDCVVFPSLIETYSAVFAETAALGIPIFVASKPYTHEFFSEIEDMFQLDKIDDLIGKLTKLKEDQYYAERSHASLKRRERSISSSERVDKLIDIFRKIIS